MKTSKKSNPVGLVELRESFGLNQKLMAMYLKINLSTLKLVETGRRLLPTHALVSVGNLELSAPKNKQLCYPTPHCLEMNDTTTCREKLEAVDARVQKCCEDQKTLTGELASAQFNYQRLRARLQIIEMAMNENHCSEMELQDWQKQKDPLKDMLAKCSIPVQLLLQTKLQVLENEIGLYNQVKLYIATEFPELLTIKKLIL